MSWNGPEMGESDEMLKKALELHLSDPRLGIHFKTNNIFKKTAGETVQTNL